MVVSSRGRGQGRGRIRAGWTAVATTVYLCYPPGRAHTVPATSSQRRAFSPAPHPPAPHQSPPLPPLPRTTSHPSPPLSTNHANRTPGSALCRRVVQYLGSLGASVILSKAAVLAGPALLYPIWSPWIRAGLRNVDLYSQSFAAIGLWRAQVGWAGGRGGAPERGGAGRCGRESRGRRNGFWG